MADTSLKFLTVRIDNHWFGIPVSQIIEVLHLMAFDELPSQREGMIGLITIRNQVMPLIDFRRLFASEPLALKLDTPVAAVRTTSGPLALLFEDADRVEDISESQLMASQNAQQFLYINGAAQQGGRVLLLLDVERMGRELSRVSPPVEAS